MLDAVEPKHAKQLREALVKHAPVRRPGLARTVIDWPRIEALFHARVPGVSATAIPSSGWAGARSCIKLLHQGLYWACNATCCADASVTREP